MSRSFSRPCPSSSPVVAARPDAANGGDAAGDKSPLDELKAMNDDTQKQIDALLQPVNDVDDIVKQVDELPKKHTKVKVADLKKMLEDGLRRRRDRREPRSTPRARTTSWRSARR